MPRKLMITPATAGMIADMRGDGATRTEIAGALGVGASCLDHWRRSRPQIAAAWEEGEIRRASAEADRLADMVGKSVPHSSAADVYAMAAEGAGWLEIARSLGLGRGARSNHASIRLAYIEGWLDHRAPSMGGGAL